MDGTHLLLNYHKQANYVATAINCPYLLKGY